MVAAALDVDGGQIEAEREAARLEQVIGQLGSDELVALLRALDGEAAQQPVQRAGGADVAGGVLVVQRDVCARL